MAPQGWYGRWACRGTLGVCLAGTFRSAEEPLQVVRLAAGIGGAGGPVGAELVFHGEVPLLHRGVLEIPLHGVQAGIGRNPADYLQRRRERIGEGDIGQIGAGGVCPESANCSWRR